MRNDLKIDIAILDDHMMMATLLKYSLRNQDFVKSINVFFDSNHFFEFIEENKIDLLIVDVFMPKMNGVDTVRKCRERIGQDDLKIIMLSSSVEYKIITEAISLGANAYVTKEDRPDEVFSAISHIYEKNAKPYFSSNTRAVFLSDSFDEVNNIKLSPREDQLLRLICESKTSKEIAFELNLSVNTIHYYTKRLMVKMNVNRTPDLILKAINKGFVLSF